MKQPSLPTRIARARKAAATRARMKAARMNDDDTILAVLAKTAIDGASAILLAAPNASLVPVFLIKNKKGVAVVATPWDNDEEKAGALQFIREKLRDLNAVAYAHVSEAWMSFYQLGEVPADGNWPEQRPSERPDRVEVVIVFASTRSKQRMDAYRIIRTPDGAVLSLDLFDPAHGADPPSLDGAFPSLFD